jgi:hypothetical protein
MIASGSVLGLSLATMPFKGRAKLNDEISTGSDIYTPVYCFFIVVMWYGLIILGGTWTFGWELKMGGVARQIRRECIRNGCIKRSEEDVEKSEMTRDSKEWLEWWIRESWKACEDRNDTP